MLSRINDRPASPALGQARKPGPAFNVAMASAFEDGADYLYRRCPGLALSANL